MTHHYKTSGTCSKNIKFLIEDGLVRSVTFEGGCDGNLQAVARLVEGLPVQEVIQRVEGIHCGRKSTSCPDQLAIALKKAAMKDTVKV